MTERDKKVLAVVAALVVLGGFWFLVVGKKRTAIAEAEKAQAVATQELTDAKNAEAASKVLAKAKPAAYSRLLRLGKAIPDTDDFQSLLVQVNDLTVDADVSFTSLSSNAATSAEATNGPSGQVSACDAGSSSSTSATTAATSAAPTTSTGPSGSTAESFVGRDRDKAKGAVASSNSSSAASAALDCDRSATLTDLSAKAAGLAPINYSLIFSGSFYNLHKVYDSLLDLVKVRNAKVKVTGRLLDINSISMTVDTFPNLTATVLLTGYRLPSEGAASASAPAAAAVASAATANGAAAGGSQ